MMMKTKMGKWVNFLPLLVLIVFFFFSVSSATSSATSSSSSRLSYEEVDVQAEPPLLAVKKKEQYFHYVLVHGACLGAWSWYKLITLLESSGHNVTSLDMASAGINLTKPDSIHSLTQYYQPLMEFLEAFDHQNYKIVLVGHSLGGLGISMAMQKYPQKISVAIFVTAAMIPMLPFSSSSSSTFQIQQQQQMEKVFEMYKRQYMKMKGDNNLFIFTETKLKTDLYPLSPPQDLTLAVTLVRPQSMVFNPLELILTREKYGSVKRAFIRSEKDKMTKKWMADIMLTLSPPDHVAEVKGSDHMVMTSKPHQLAKQLIAIAKMFSISSTSIYM